MRHLCSALLAVMLAPIAFAAPDADYVVFVDGGPASPFAPAARKLAEFHRGQVEAWDPAKLNDLLASLQKLRPEFVAFALPPEKIDVDLVRAIIGVATRVDDDPFLDFEYGFITGRDGRAAEQFVERVLAGWKHPPNNKAAIFGSWDGPMIPPSQPTAAQACGFTLTEHYIRSSDAAEAKSKAARAALEKLSGHDLLLFFSHGYPDQMVGCFRAADLRGWKIDLAPAVLINCSCYNGAPGRWYEPRWGQPAQDRGIVPPDESVALALLDSGVAAYVAGIDPWHGPLANQVSGYIMGDGMRLGQAVKMMQDRLALEFLPERIAYVPAREYQFAGEGVGNRRSNGAGMIFYGDPAWAPFEKLSGARIKATAAWGPVDLERERLANTVRERPAAAADELPSALTIRIEVPPLVANKTPGTDFMLAQNRLVDYYSWRDAKGPMTQLQQEVYCVVPLPEGASFERAPKLRVTRAECLGNKTPTGTPQVELEQHRGQRRLHVRVPISIPAYGTPMSWIVVQNGISIDLAEDH